MKLDQQSAATAAGRQDRRRVERFPLFSRGYALVNGARIGFTTHDISLDGSLIEFHTAVPLAEGTQLDICLDVGFMGKAKVCRVASRNDRTLFGINFTPYQLNSETIH